MKFLKKLTAAALSLTLLPVFPARAQGSADYARIEFGASYTPTMTNIKNYTTVGDTGTTLHPMRVGGRWGHSTNKDKSLGKGLSYGVLLDIDDDFMHNLPAGTGVKLTIEYWDGVHPVFPGDFDADKSDTFARLRAHYDSNGTGDQISVDGDAITHLTPDFVVRTRDKWNKAIFILDDFKAGNGIMNRWDIEVTDWGGSVNVARDVIYRSITVEYYDAGDDMPLELSDSLNLGVSGNFEDIEKAELTLSVPMENTSGDAIKVSWDFEIYNENNILIDNFDHTCALAANEKRTDSVTFANPGLCGVYEIRAVASAELENGDIVTKYMGDENFSVAHISKVGEGNDNLGINVHSVGGGYGNIEEIADVLSMAGFGWIREANQWRMTKNSSGDWVVSDGVKSDFEYVKSKGIKVLMQLWGPMYAWENGSTAGKIPTTDGDREIFEKWCEDLAKQLNGKIDAYEIFNEPPSTMFPSGFEGDKGAEYVKALELAYTALKKANSSIPVVGPVTATQLGEDTEFTKQVYAAGGGDYLDIHSTHRYPYTGTLYVKELLTSSGRETEETVITNSADGVTPPEEMWLTEFGYTTPNKLADGGDTGGSADPWGNTYWNSYFGLGYYDSVPRRTQAQGLALGYAVTHGFDNSFDKLFVHHAIDFTDPTNSEHSWGVMNSYSGADGYTPYSAKPSLVATAAFNHFIDDSSVVKGILDKDCDGKNDWNRRYAIWFDNSKNTKFGKDVIYVQTEIATEAEMTLSVGATSVEVFDIYGNSLGTMKSTTGVYELRASIEPYYLVGDFTKCEEAGAVSAALVSAPTLDKHVVKDCKRGDSVTFTLSGLKTGDSVDVIGFEAVSISGSTVTIKTPDIYEGRAYGFIRVKDSSGNLRGALPIELWIPDPALYLSTNETGIDIYGLAARGGDDVSVIVTDDTGLPVALTQERAKESGVIDMRLEIPDADKTPLNLKLYNGGGVAISQQLVPNTQMWYTCLLNGDETVPAGINPSTLDENDELEFVLRISGATGTPKLTLYGACYDGDGKLVYLDSDSTDDTFGGSDTLTIKVNPGDAETIRLFVWDGDNVPVKKVTNIN